MHRSREERARRLCGRGRGGGAGYGAEGRGLWPNFALPSIHCALYEWPIIGRERAVTGPPGRRPRDAKNKTAARPPAPPPATHLFIPYDRVNLNNFTNAP